MDWASEPAEAQAPSEHVLRSPGSSDIDGLPDAEEAMGIDCGGWI
jgi:hypothetical protein